MKLRLIAFALVIAIAIFAYLKITGTAKQHDLATRAQMHIMLSALYGAEKSQFGEYQHYTSDWNSMGFYPEGGFNIKFGFLKAYVPPHPLKGERPELMNTDAIFAAGAQSPYFALSGEGKRVHLEDAAPFCRKNCTVDETGFEAIAVGEIAGQLDVWSVDEHKTFTHLTGPAP